MPGIGQWSSSMVSAWQYAVSGVERGMTATEALADYRSGGGAIRTQDWYYLSREAQGARARGEIVAGLPFEQPIPSSAYTTVDMDYGQKYVVIQEATYTDAATGQRMTRDITLEYDDVETAINIRSDAVDTLLAYGVEGGESGITFGSALFYTPAWASIPFE